MAVKLIANYAKRLGLPGYSSHQFSVSVKTEMHDVENVAAESERLGFSSVSEYLEALVELDRQGGLVMRLSGNRVIYRRLSGPRLIGKFFRKESGTPVTPSCPAFQQSSE